ncbi:toprim domain-containing protein [Sporosarcina sp. E16_3]|uniref:toprim domain-containing protein n=1 Tax=Sporosarcina sp. E16_3 TaxID=2789293 RepID=UPI001A913A22|nr:toprim domain-containing protein [Sporosarcina sp. E16_3]MBO0602745.1 toprim domain-containing protein [Sporosarcina sp. E16_3]
MPIIKIRNHEVDVDITEELSAYNWQRPRWSADKLIAASPFRPDDTPSFFVMLDGDYAGSWGDSGAFDDEYKSGSFTKLLAYLREESHEETERYLLDQYGILYEDAEDIRLPEIRLAQRGTVVQVPSDTVTQAVSPYLTRRGISAVVQRQYGVGYSENYKGYTAMPWHTPDGRIANVKYRSTKGKTFFYEKGATPINTLVYGLANVNADKATTAVLCEGEIDALSWATAGIHGIALGGSSLSGAQLDAIKRSSIRRLLVGGDNDGPGRRLNAQIIRELSGYVELYGVDYKAHNDANTVLVAEGSEGLRKMSNDSLSKPSVICIQIPNIGVK